MALRAIYLIVGLWVVALVGFWPTYFTRLQEVALPAHLHGLLVFGWYLLLLVQATLIHTHRRPLHRLTGRVSYAYVPLLVLGTLGVAHVFLARGPDAPTAYGLRIFAAILSLLLAFLVLYVQALRYRSEPMVHGRLMLCTGIVFLMPALARFIGIQIQPALFPPTEPPTLDELTFGDNAALVCLQVLTLVLLLIDWRRGRNVMPYALCLALLLIAHGLFRWLPEQSWWAGVGRAFIGLWTP
jgi:hypothetical protein